MNVYQINWQAIVDRPLVAALAAAASLDTVPRPATVKPALARILQMTGGWPYVTPRPGRTAQRELALRMLGEAFAQTLGRVPEQVPGMVISPARSGMRAITTVERLEVNRADAADLAAVPGLSSALAYAIVAERLRGGPFRNAAELAARVANLGASRAHKLSPYLGFMPPSPSGAGATGDLALDLKALLAQENSGGVSARLARVLDRVAMQVSMHPHPNTIHELPVAAKMLAPPQATTVERTRLLLGRHYYGYVRNAIRNADARIDIAMFHIALPRSDHPTRRLLDALAAARSRGVRIRVLVDRDRATDPYHSTVINAAAVNLLLDSGISVRVDAPRKLLHSKFLVIDSDRTIIGSHNWSAGSYFGFDDLSVDIESATFARSARRRFAALWRDADVASRSGPP